MRVTSSWDLCHLSGTQVAVTHAHSPPVETLFVDHDSPRGWKYAQFPSTCRHAGKQHLADLAPATARYRSLVRKDDVRMMAEQTYSPIDAPPQRRAAGELTSVSAMIGCR
jgi:hypothetical protein